MNWDLRAPYGLALAGMGMNEDLRNGERRPWIISILCGSIASVLLNAAMVLSNASGMHNRAVERFFVVGSLIFPGFESGIFVVASNTIVFAILLTLLSRIGMKILQVKRTED